MATLLPLDTPTSVSGPANTFFHYVVPAAAADRTIEVTIDGGAEDVDLMLKLGTDMSEVDYDYDTGSFSFTSHEKAAVLVPAGQALYVILESYSDAFAGLALLAVERGWKPYALPNLGAAGIYEDIEWQQAVANASRTRFYVRGRGDSLAYLASSSDLKTWIVTTLPQNADGVAHNWVDMVCRGDKLCMISQETSPYTPAASLTTSDGITLSGPHDLPLIGGIWTLYTAIACSPTKFVIASQQRTIHYSADGESWTQATLPDGSGSPTVAYDGTHFVTSYMNDPGDSILRSADNGVTWSYVAYTLSPGESYNIERLRSGDGYIVGGLYTPVISFDHGATWAQAAGASSTTPLGLPPGASSGSYAKGYSSQTTKVWIQLVIYQDGTDGPVYPRFVRFDLNDLAAGYTNVLPIPACDGLPAALGFVDQYMAATWFGDRFLILGNGALYEYLSVRSFWTGFINCEDSGA